MIINKIKSVLFILVILILQTSLNACDAVKSTEGKKMSKDLAILSKIISIPVPPEEAWWQEVEMGSPGRLEIGPKDRAFVAVLKLKKNDMESIIKRSNIASDDTVRLDKSMVFSWYPDELKKLMKPLPDGSSCIKGAIFEPTLFITNSSYTRGYMLKISEDKIFLSLGTM